MNKLTILLIAVILLSTAGLAQAQEKDTLEAKLAKLDTATTVEATTAKKAVCEKKT